MSLHYFLIVSALVYLSSGITFADDTGKKCPYYGKKDRAVLEKLTSEEFKNNLSPFGRLFLEAIPSEDFFYKLFDVSFNSKTVVRTFFLNCVYYGVKMNLRCPIKLCKGVARGVGSAFSNKISATDYFQVVVNTLESSLEKEGKLKSMDENAINETIQTFIRDVAENLCSPEIKTPIQALFALNDGGAIKFFKKMGVTNRKQVSSIAQSFGDNFAKLGDKNKESSGVLKLDLVFDIDLV